MIYDILSTWLALLLITLGVLAADIQNKIYLVIVIVAIGYIVLKTDILLPFLGPMALPHTLIVEPPPAYPVNEYQPEPREPRQPESSEIIKVMLPFKVTPNTRVLFWAANSGKWDSPKEAYGAYNNAGVAMIEENGDSFTAKLAQKPGEYRVFFSLWKLQPHIHYRFIKSDGLLSRVYTYYLTSDQ